MTEERTGSEISVAQGALQFCFSSMDHLISFWNSCQKFFSWFYIIMVLYHHYSAISFTLRGQFPLHFMKALNGTPERQWCSAANKGGNASLDGAIWWWINMLWFIDLELWIVMNNKRIMNLWIHRAGDCLAYGEKINL